MIKTTTTTTATGVPALTSPCSLTTLTGPAIIHDHILTTDNAKEFAQHKRIASALKADFCKGIDHHLLACFDAQMSRLLLPNTGSTAPMA